MKDTRKTSKPTKVQPIAKVKAKMPKAVYTLTVKPAVSDPPVPEPQAEMSPSDRRICDEIAYNYGLQVDDVHDYFYTHADSNIWVLMTHVRESKTNEKEDMDFFECLKYIASPAFSGFEFDDFEFDENLDFL